MSDPTLYQRMRKVALPHLKHYLTDLTVHDRAISQAMRPGDTAIYAVRNSGTHVACYRNTDDADSAKAAQTAQNALDYIDAIVGTGSDIRWFLLECTSPRRGTVSPIPLSRARFMVMMARDLHRAASSRRVAA